MILAFDFDGTITKENLYPHCGQYREGIVDCINALSDEGHFIIIYSCRATNNVAAFNAYHKMINSLENNGVQYDTINTNINPSTIFNPVKPYWDLLIDDTALGFNPDWTGEDIYNLIQERIKNKQINKLDLTKNT